MWILRKMREGPSWARLAGLIVATLFAACSPPTEAEPRVNSLSWSLFIGEAAPGAAFDVLGGSDAGGLPGEGSRVIGRWESSQPNVADWEVTPHPGGDYNGRTTMRLVFKSPGIATVSLSFGGQSLSKVVRVRNPGALTMDSLKVCGLATDGSAWCTGANDYGQLGTLTAIFYWSRYKKQQGSAIPVRSAPQLTFRTLATVKVSWGTTTCGISTGDSRVYCWGVGSYTGLGGPAPTEDCVVTDFTFTYQQTCSFTPLAVDRNLGGPLSFKTLEADDSEAKFCGSVTATPGDEVWCWGGAYGPIQKRPGMFQ